MKRWAALWVVAVTVVTGDAVAADDRVALLAPEATMSDAAGAIACVDEALAKYEDLVFGEIGPPGRPTFDSSRQAALDAAILESERSPLVSLE